jgi:DNA-binding SARP family transcriptional activator
MTQSTRPPVRTPPSLSLLGGFNLVVDGKSVPMRIHAQRVLAYLSLVQPARRAHLRTGLAERLWGGVPAERSHASLRTALWRIRQADPRLVRASRDIVRLDDAVEVDVRSSIAQAGRLLAADALEPRDAEIGSLRGDLLPGWDEDWLLLERERIRQVQIHALEALARRLCVLGRHLESIEAAFAAIAGEPLRESAHAALIDTFLAEGNVAQAHHQLDHYAGLVWAEFGIRPSAALTNRVATSGLGHGEKPGGHGNPVSGLDRGHGLGNQRLHQQAQPTLRPQAGHRRGELCGQVEGTDRRRGGADQAQHRGVAGGAGRSPRATAYVEPVTALARRCC